MSMFDDLDPDFLPSPGAALPMVAARVGAVRRRRAKVAGGAVGSVLLIILVTTAFRGGSKPPDRLTVSRKVTTTSGSPTTVPTLVTIPTTSSSTSTTVAATTTSSTIPPATLPSTTTTVPRAHITFTFDRSGISIKSGTTATFSFTLKNDGDAAGKFGDATCPVDQVWPDRRSREHPLLWPLPVNQRSFCGRTTTITVAAHSSHTIHRTVAAGLYDGDSDRLVPAPPGDTSYLVRNGLIAGATYRLPITITPPDSLPLTVDHPVDVTAASGGQNLVDFTITNNLPFQVRYVDQGPCSSDVGTPCDATTPDGKPSGDLRQPPYDKAVKPLYFTHYLLNAGEVRASRAQVNGTAGLADNSTAGALLPGIYHFDWDNKRVKFTVT